MKTLTYSEFRERRINFQATRPEYLKNIESDFENMTQFMYKMYLQGKVPVFAK